ncbi:SGNH/GDSL hydrolase family protein [Ideonella sp. BN130291]|uniref:SGNH/GDSL hydrolase family protein n=1 Tax=Ideonella sp. BN130291 TaxID=3112940 RepID=UPI002E27645A|nr:SGNH/GDSL hydrolase family protein [Ideonella sp. BN130291]
MKFSGISARAALRCFAGAAAAALLALAGCGGGDQIDPFRPNRILAFGDEASVIVPNGTSQGLKYTINSFAAPASSAENPNPPAVAVCTSNPLWIQSVASAFGLVFDECKGSAATSSGKILATVSAKSTDIATQIDNFLATSNGGFTDKDVVTLMAGQNDVLEQYALYPATPEATIMDNLRVRAKALAEQANRIAVAGPAVIVVRIPDVGLTPFARAQETANPGRAALLSRMTLEFNTALQLNLINDGHLIGLVFGDTAIQNLTNFSTGLNVTAAACTAPATADLLGCTTANLATGISSTSHLWAGSTMLSPVGQSSIGSLAANRAISNPF